jgi:excisionase family DNA binding protein
MMDGQIETRPTPTETLQPRLSVAQLARAWGVSRQQIYNLVDRGELRSIRVGSLLRFRPKDVRDYECRDQNPINPPIPLPDEAPIGTSSGGKLATNSGYHAALRMKQRRAAS